MGIIQGIRQGLTQGLAQGISPALANAISDLAASADPGGDLAAIMGTVAPGLMYYGGDASGATELISGSSNLSDGGTPGKQQTDHNFVGDTKTTEIITGSTDQMIAALSSVADVGAVPLAILYAGQLVSTSGTLGLFGKREAAGSNLGYELNHNNGGFLSWVCDSSSGAAARTISVDHGTSSPFSALVTRKITANEQNIYSNKGSATGGRFAETLANSIKLSVGLGRLSGHAHHMALMAIWINAGEDFDSAHLNAFNTWAGIN